MDFTGERYYKLNRILLLCLGLWPYQDSGLKKIQIIFFETLFTSFLLCQLNAFLVIKCDIEIILKISMYVVINFIYIIKYNAYFLLADNIKHIFDRIRFDWNILKTQAELDIIRRYADNAKLSTICFMFTVAILTLLITSCIPCIFDIIMPMNDSRPRRLPILVEYYFIDEEVHFYIILTHIIVTMYAGCVTIAAIATLLIAYALHTCAMFKITSYRMEHICDENVQQIPKDLKQHVFYEKLIHAVHLHRRALDLATILTNNFAIFYFVLLAFGVSSAILSVVNFVNIVFLDDVESLIFFGILFIHLYYIFLGNYVGQNIIDTSTDIHQTIYNTQWYTAPLWIQKSILLIIRRSSKKSALIAGGGLFNASLEGFAMVRQIILPKNVLISMPQEKKYIYYSL
ncbi:uncharacterized protein LOC109610503 isoform X2 [Camponotus floridanus]|uniref:uncharacterized protein LOC109610503 isoform X2 n=1 Tax=Camponotus floridanus TaxID=104421 RepID=UPI000DC6ABD4|nr:uncharacterized protein LOC109610503 isoform X2 [Camponotus floridanus]